ncbi:MAG TPA: DUF5996 family protein [Terriglobales bacterium]
MPSRDDAWPELLYPSWKPTCYTLHMWLQIAGKVRLALGPHLNHFWEATYYVTPRGLTSGAIPRPGGVGIFSFEFDFVADQLRIETSERERKVLSLRPCKVADFEAEVLGALAGLGIEARIWPMPVEVPNPVRFDLDHDNGSYDADAVRRWWRILVACQRVFAQVRGEFQGKASPVHVFWGSMDLAYTRFSGRPAPPRPEAPVMMQEAYSCECASAGFWPGDERFPEAAFYAYAVPEPGGYAGRVPHPKAFYHKEMGEFLLRYDDIRAARDPETELLGFLRQSFAAAAELGNWPDAGAPPHSAVTGR